MPTKDEIKIWLRENGYSYEWLAKKCFVTYNTVRNWMAKQPIPPSKLAFISKLMKDSVEADEQTFTIELEFSEEERAIINEYKSRHPRFDPKIYAEQKLMEFCAGLLSYQGVADEHAPSRLPFKTMGDVAYGQKEDDDEDEIKKTL